MKRYLSWAKVVVFVFITLTCNVVSAADNGVVMIYGDTRGNDAIHSKIVTKIVGERPEAVFFLGDFVLDGNNPNEWKSIHEITSSMRAITKFYPIAGNHEKESKLYYDEFNNELLGQKWLKTKVKNVNFVLLDSNLDLKPGSKQYMWLEDTLKSYSRDGYVIIMLHHPPFSVSKHANDVSDYKEQLIELAERYKVNAIITGHDHNYQRFQKKNVHYLLVGGGGAPLYDKMVDNQYLKKFVMSYCYCKLMAKDDGLEFSVYDDNGQLLDSVKIE